VTWAIHEGDALEVLRGMPDERFNACVTSPPYWGLRDYGIPPTTWGDGWVGCLGLEPTPQQYVVHLVELLGEVRRVLRADGVLWMNLGDSYATGAGAVGQHPGGGEQGARWRGDVDRIRDDKRGYRGERLTNGRGDSPAVLRKRTRALRDGTHAGKNAAMAALGPMTQPNRMPIQGLKPKDLVGIPWRSAFALQADGWWLRSDVIWSKANPMPEGVRDRPTKAHEYVFLLSKSERYAYDADAIAEPAGWPEGPGNVRPVRRPPEQSEGADGNTRWRLHDIGPRGDARQTLLHTGPRETRNARSVWTIATQPYAEAHFATFPPELARRCVLSACPPGGTVLDPFAGAGTTLMVAARLGRHSEGIELNPTYAAMARRRIERDAPLFNVQHPEPAA